MLRLLSTRAWSWPVKHPSLSASCSPLWCHFHLQCQPLLLVATGAFDKNQDFDDRYAVQKDEDEQGADGKPHQGGQRHGRWMPKKRLTRYQMDHLKSLRQEDPDTWTVNKLSQVFCISPLAVKRILRSKFEPSLEVQERQDAKALQQREERRQNFKLQQTTQTTEKCE